MLMLVMWVRLILYFILTSFDVFYLHKFFISDPKYDCENVVGSAFMLGRSLTSILWGIIADRYGRKPVAILGIISV